MKKENRLALLVFCSLLSVSTFAQSRFNNCSAAFLDQKMVVNDYSPDGKCMLDSTARGTLTVSPATYENNVWIADAPAEFMVAIRDKTTGSICMYSDKRYQKIEISRVMAKCRKGDRIVLIPLDERLALLHNEILIL